MKYPNRLSYIIRTPAICGSFLLSAILFTLPGTLTAEDFAADVVNRTASGSVSGRIFVSKDKVRLETGPIIMITRIDRNTAFIVMPEQKTYIEQRIDPNIIAISSEKMPGEIERKFIGEETIEGRNVKKYRVTYNSKNGEVPIFQWIDNDLLMPVKAASTDGSWEFELSKIVPGPQSDSVFSIPDGYKKLVIPSVEDLNKAAADME